MSILHTVLGLFVVAFSFGFIVFIHEMGHFLAARAVGIRCPQFAVGVGPALFSFRRKGTLFALRLFPIGGYVLMVGEDPNADPEDSWHHVVSQVLQRVRYPISARQILADWESLTSELTSSERAVSLSQLEEVREHLAEGPQDVPFANQLELEGNFNHKTVPQRMVVILGGVVMNFLAAILLMWCLGFTVGRGEMRQDTQALVATVQDGGPAQRAGVQAGDVVVGIDGLPVVSGEAMMRLIGERPCKPSTMSLNRKGQTVDYKLTPDCMLVGIFLADSADGPRVDRVLADFGKEIQKDAAPNDVITSVNGRAVNNMQGFISAVREELSHKKAEDEVTLRLGRRNKGDLELKTSAYRLNPQGKTGIVPARASTLSFVRTAGHEVESVSPGSPAADAGFLPGDELHSIDGFQVYSDLSSDKVLGELAAGSGAANPGGLRVEIFREGQLKLLTVPGAVPSSLNSLGLKLKPITAEEILATPFRYIWRAICTPYQLISGLAHGILDVKTVKKESTGPIGMMRMIYQVSENGLASLLFFVAVLNALIGGFNLFPFPALDGSRFAMLCLAGVRGKEIDPSREMVFHFTGIMVLLCLVGIISIQDVQTWWAGTPLMK